MIEIFQTSSGFSFCPVDGAAETLLIETPPGSAVLPMPGLTEPARLFVPAGRCLRVGHAAAEVVRAARGRRRWARFV